MDIDHIRNYCRSLPHTTEQVQWEDNLVFKVGGKMYAVAALEPRAHWLSFKCSPEDFATLTERPGISPAPYLARAQWIALETSATLPPAELENFLALAHEVVFAKLSKKQQSVLNDRRPSSPGKSNRRRTSTKPPAKKSR